VDVWRSHSDTPHSVGTHNTRKRQTAIPPGWIRNRISSKQAAGDPRLRPRGHWDRLATYTRKYKQIEID